MTAMYELTQVLFRIGRAPNIKLEAVHVGGKNKNTAAIPFNEPDGRGLFCEG